MLFSINLIEIFPLQIINIFFFLVFFLILTLSYPIGRYFLSNYCENSLIKYSLFSITVFSTIVAITVNLAPILAKYVIVIFYLINLFSLIISSKVRNDLFNAIISFKFILLSIFLIFLTLCAIYKNIYLEKDELIYFFNSHDPYYIDPIIEILTSDYFSRIKIFSHYPLEWSSYHFFQASFHSIFLSPIYQSGTLGLLSLKYFYFSIFLSLFCSSFFKDNNFNREEYLKIIFKVFLIILLFISLFYSRVSYFILTKSFISTLSIIFIIQSLLYKNKNDFLIWTIILSLSSLRNIFISLMLVVYYLIESQQFNFENIINRIKESLIKPNVVLVGLFILYIIATFYKIEVITPKFNLLPEEPQWWIHTTSNNIIENYKYFLLFFAFLIIFYLFLLKYFFKEKFYISLYLKKKDLFYFSLILIIPFICIILLFFKNQIINIYTVEKLKIYFDHFNLTNLSYYFFIPLLWSVILINSKVLIRYIFLLTIIIYTFLSIFIYNGIVVTAFYTLEFMLLFYISHFILEFKKADRKKTLWYLFIFLIVIFSIFNSNNYDSVRQWLPYNTGSKIVFKIKDLKELKKKKYLCPQDIKYNTSNKYSVTALSGILVKPYYSNISLANRYSNWSYIPLRFAISPKKQSDNPCSSKYE